MKCTVNLMDFKDTLRKKKKKKEKEDGQNKLLSRIQ